MPYNFLRTLSTDFERLLVDEDDHNVVITVGEEPNTKVFKAHSNILKTRSPYFCRALSSEWVVKENNIIQYNKPNLTPVVFQLILKYIYCGVISLDKQDVMDIMDLLIAADEFILEELVGFVQDFLIEFKASWLRDNVGQIIHTVFRLQTCTVLQNHLINEICQDARSFFISREFTALEQEILIALLKRDDLEMDEIDVWKCVLDWGTAQTQGLGAQASTWSADDFATLERTLRECIPLLRFRQISLSDFYDHVRPFKSIITHDLYEDLVRSHYKPGSDAKLTISANQMPRICSSVLQPKHVALLSHWIEGASGQPESYLRTNHAFRLLYRATRDGFSPSAFRSKCNGQGAMLVALKLEDTNRIVGGYNPIGWCNRGVYADTKESFLFNLGTTDDEMDGARLCRVVPEKSGSAIFDLSSYGPNFGPGDLVVYEDSRKCNCMRSDVYENEVVEPGEYQLAEFEAFKLTCEVGMI